MGIVPLIAVLLAVTAPQEPSPIRPSPLEQARAAVDACVGRGVGDVAGRDRAAAAIAAAGRPAVHELAVRIAAARTVADAEGQADGAALAALVPAVGVEVLRRELATGYVFAGQYDELRELMPEVGAFFAGLVVAPPDWLPPADVAVVLPVLRDVYAAPPDEALRARLRAMAGDESLDAAIRRSIACALAQWGEREVVDREQAALEARIAKGHSRDALLARSELARLCYEVRDHARAAAAQVDYLRTAEQHRKSLLRPIDYYNAACHLCLCGRIDDAMREIERCVELQRTVAAHLRVDRRLFDHDPELNAIRATQEFRDLVQRAFDR